mmetsp:Transcript_127993/g.208508  ORF Transcript_127993/g.208508 Transcript_127993/m.208508 type:complete len:285 (+) Transcript_127993:67-921(+)
MGQLRKVIDYDTAKSPRSSSAETSPRADGDCTASASSLESRAPPSKCKTHFNLNPKAPAFAPSQTLMNGNFFAAASQFSLDPTVPAFVVPSQALMNNQVDTLLTALCPEASALPHDFMAPPGLEGCFAPSPPQLPGLRKGAKQASRGKNNMNSNNRRGDTMKAQLEALQLEDPSAVFITRGINKLGFSSAKALKAHFSRYGEVKAIYAPPSRVKSMHGYGEGRQTEAHWRLRAAPLGFIVMKSSEATARILADGPEQSVNGVPVRLQPFQRHACCGSEDELEHS